MKILCAKYSHNTKIKKKKNAEANTLTHIPATKQIKAKRKYRMIEINTHFISFAISINATSSLSISLYTLHTVHIMKTSKQNKRQKKIKIIKKRNKKREEENYTKPNSCHKILFQSVSCLWVAIDNETHLLLVLNKIIIKITKKYFYNYNYYTE